jgi:hypothetical protein
VIADVDLSERLGASGLPEPNGRRPGGPAVDRLRLREAVRYRAGAGRRSNRLAEHDVHGDLRRHHPRRLPRDRRRRGRAGSRRRQPSPYYSHYDIRATATASGDVDGDGAPDAVVLLDCSPQPSNGIVQEVRLYSSTGRSLGALPSPRSLQGVDPVPPVYDPAGLSVQHGEIVAAMMAYGPDDFHASGPSVPVTVR